METINGNHGQQSSLTAYVLTEIENRPPANIHVPQPPVQSVYPTFIQNNYNGQPLPINQHPTSLHSYNSSSSLPSSLPSIVHEFSNIFTSNNNNQLPITSQIESKLYAQSVPIITSTYNNRDSDASEKIVVKVVKAPGWYLNDENERRSYFNALKHGLLGNNGFVYVNNVQKEIKSIANTLSSKGGETYSHRTLNNQARFVPTQNIIQTNIHFPCYSPQVLNAPSSEFYPSFKYKRSQLN